MDGAYGIDWYAFKASKVINPDNTEATKQESDNESKESSDDTDSDQTQPVKQPTDKKADAPIKSGKKARDDNKKNKKGSRK